MDMVTVLEPEPGDLAWRGMEAQGKSDVTCLQSQLIGRIRQEDPKLEACLDNLVRSCLK